MFPVSEYVKPGYVRPSSKIEIFKEIENVLTNNGINNDLGYDISTLPDKPYLAAFLYWINDGNYLFVEPPSSRLYDELLNVP